MMDPVTRLDSALFQLTPTRTRFDLVLFRGNKSEKLASGLFDPFVSHLKFARDQIAKGGYSISLRPPKNDDSWFTKATFERFVRFVNTPAIIERFVSLEKEILQIGHSIQANESSDANGTGQQDEGSNLKKSSDSAKLRSEFNENNEGMQEESSRSQLHRLLETRKILLRREQAMAYARGVVAGFEMDCMDSLISFADAFGASRLREACINYKELWMKKHGDGIWMAELAAVQASSPSDIPGLVSSGIILTNELNGFSSNGSESATTNASPNSKRDDNSHASEPVAAKFQAPMPWPNQMPPYFYNFGGSVQQMPPYQAYPFPPMHPDSHQYPGYMQRPSKGKFSSKKGSESSESETESDDDSASSMEDQDKKHSENKKDHRHSRRKNRNKSSKTVIIRNINYINPDGRNEYVENDDNELMDRLSTVGLLGNEKQEGARRDSENGVAESGSEVRSSNENWDNFQNLLMRDEAVEKSHAADIGEEQFALRSSAVGVKSKNVQTEGNISADSFLVSQMNRDNDTRARSRDFENGGSDHKLTRKRGTSENIVLPGARSELFGSEDNHVIFANEANGPIIKSGRGEDWFVANHDAGNQPKTYDGDLILSSDSFGKPKTNESRKEMFIDDSFMVQHTMQTTDGVYDSRLIPDASMVADLENGNAKTQKENHEVVDAGEPNDLFMVLERNSKSAEYSWGLDFEAELFDEANGRRESAQSNKEDENNGSKGEKAGSLKNGKKEAKSRLSTGSLGKNRTESLYRSAKKPSLTNRTLTQKSKSEKEEEMRKRLEEVAIQRQKRIAERTAAAAARKGSMEGKTTKGGNSTSDKNRTNRSTPLR